MPHQPSWLDRVREIIATLDEPELASVPFLTRASIESLFGLKRRAAIELMKKIGRFQVGKEFVIRKGELVRWLKRASLGDQVWYEEVRRQRVEDLVDQIWWEREAKKPRVVVPEKTFELKLEGMPSTVLLKPGEMKIEFNGAEDLFRQLFEIAQVIQNDYERFRRLVES